MNYHDINIIDIQIIITLKNNGHIIKNVVSFYLKFEDKFKSFVKFGLNTLYNKMEI